MKSPAGINALAVALGLFALACGTDQEGSLTAPNPSFTVSGNPVVASATGSGHLETGGELRTFAFTAKRKYDGTVLGQFQVNNRSQDRKAHGPVTCITTDGSTAHIGGVIETSDDPALVGLDAIFTVVDNSEGPQSPPDLISLISPGQTGSAATHCATPFSLVLNPIQKGNIQVDQQGGP